MKAKVIIHLHQEFEIDLVEHGLEKNEKFEDLSEDEQINFKDCFLDEVYPTVTIKTI